MGKPQQHAVERRIARLLDANVNRAAEGLRVVEDTARFVWEADALYRRVRALRHRLHTLLRPHERALLLARESRRDAGRVVAELPRASLAHIVKANMRRAQEAVRVLEEFSKVRHARSAPAFKALRYRLYEEEKRLLRWM